MFVSTDTQSGEGSEVKVTVIIKLVKYHHHLNQKVEVVQKILKEGSSTPKDQLEEKQENLKQI